MKSVGWTILLAILAASPWTNASAAEPPAENERVWLEVTAQYRDFVRPLLNKFCTDCHSPDDPKGELDLQRFDSLARVRADLRPWQLMIEQLQSREMPPREMPQPTAAERQRLVAWIRTLLDAEAREHAGDPGHVPLRRLSHAEYDRTIRDLTGVDLRPTREFPADGAAGEGFTNAAEALTMSPALMTKYLNAAKEVADHAVLLPDGFRFSPSQTRRDWTNESVARLREFYSRFTSGEGRLPLAPYLNALARHRTELNDQQLTFDELARREQLSPRYLAELWRALHAADATFPLNRIQSRWQQTTPDNVDSLVAEITAWQKPLWRFVPIGSYRYGATERQVAQEPTVVARQPLRFEIKPEPGEQAVTLHLVAHDYSGATSGNDAATKANVVWHRPRLQRAGQPPRMLADYAEFAKDFELDYAALFAGSSRYLAASREAAHQANVPMADIAKRHGVDAEWLRRWTETLDVRPLGDDGSPSRSAREPGRTVAAVPLESLDTKTPPNNERPTINGWQPAGADLPIVISNSGDETLHVPGRIGPHQVAMHPTPQQFVAAVWTSPIASRVRIEATIAHAHPACGNGVAWWLELRRPQRAAVLAEGVLDLGKQTQTAVDEFTVVKGDVVLLAVDARDANHVCDLTEVAFQVSAVAEDKAANNQVWNLAADVANNIQAGNPHADRFGNADVWRFVRGPARQVKAAETGPSIPADSIVGRWRTTAADPRRSEESATLARQVESLLAGTRPAEDKAANRAAYDYLLSLDGPLLGGIETARLAALARQSSARDAKPDGKNDAAAFALPRNQFVAAGETNGDALNLTTRVGETLSIRLPATLFREHVFVVEATVGPSDSARVVRCEVRMTLPDAGETWDGQSPWLTSGDTATERLERGLADFRRLFPWFICYPHVIPLDEVVCLKTFHREDEPLIDLFLSDKQTAEIDRLWDNHRFISRFPVVENEYLPLFIGFVTQDQPKELLDYFESQREPFRQRAEAFEREFDAAAPMQLERLAEFAARAYRRPLTADEAAELRSLYQTLRSKGVTHDEAFRGVLARVLVSPSFLFHLEQHPPGDQPQPVSDWELASRLSYFLWSSLPDDELRELAAAGRLHEPDVLAAQTRRMLTDDRVRALAVEFGTQWIHVRGFDQMNEKNERLFPTFNAELRTAMNEESVRFFQYLLQQDRPITDILDADYAMLNETMARHYGIPDVAGDHWRRVDGVRAFGRGGILGLASVQTKQAGASRTSPVLRGNWVVETLLGERLPRPPANVPPLPEEETGNDGLTMRQLVEKHVRVESCANCHRRIDPFGFALERYDAIGRLRETDLGGLPVDSQVSLRDGTRFDGIDGLREYLLGTKRGVFVRLFCRRLLGYALARETTLSDQPLIDEMVASLEQHDGRLSAAVLTIVQSPQFRMIRSQDQTEEPPR